MYNTLINSIVLHIFIKNNLINEYDLANYHFPCFYPQIVIYLHKYFTCYKLNAYEENYTFIFRCGSDELEH